MFVTPYRQSAALKKPGWSTSALEHREPSRAAAHDHELVAVDEPALDQVPRTADGILDVEHAPLAAQGGHIGLP